MFSQLPSIPSIPVSGYSCKEKLRVKIFEHIWLGASYLFPNLTIAGKANTVECSTSPSPFISTVFHRKQGPKQHCTASFVPTNQGSLHQGPSMGMVWSYLYEAGVLWLFPRYLIFANIFADVKNLNKTYRTPSILGIIERS